jgi:hypothetical protein
MQAAEKMSGLTRLPRLPRVDRIFCVVKSLPKRKRRKTLTRFEPSFKSGLSKACGTKLAPLVGEEIRRGLGQPWCRIVGIEAGRRASWVASGQCSLDSRALSVHWFTGAQR